MWQTMAIITGPKYLRDIQKTLNRLAEDINFIKRFLVYKEIAGLQANVIYLRRCFRDISEGACNEEELRMFLNQAEDAERQSLKTFYTLQQELTEQIRRYDVAAGSNYAKQKVNEFYDW